MVFQPDMKVSIVSVLRQFVSVSSLLIACTYIIAQKYQILLNNALQIRESWAYSQKILICLSFSNATGVPSYRKFIYILLKAGRLRLAAEYRQVGINYISDDGLESIAVCPIPDRSQQRLGKRACSPTRHVDFTGLAVGFIGLPPVDNRILARPG